MAQTGVPEISIVVISFNTRQMTLDCIASIYEQTTLPFELIVLDNASDDGSADAIAQAFPQATLIREATNHGFGPAHAVAMKHATTPWVLLLNPDTVILDGAIDKLFAFAGRTPDAGIWGGRTVFGDRSLNPASCFRAMSVWSIFCRILGLNAIFRRSDFFNSEFYGDWQRDTERDVHIVSGCFFLLRRSLWDQLGGFDPDFFMYGEEADLCLRARELGIRPRVTPEATIIHYGGASQTAKADRLIRLMRGKTELISRHFHPLTRGFGRWMFGLWPLSRAIAYGVIAKLRKGGSSAQSAQTWSEVWKRRNEWKSGYS